MPPSMLSHAEFLSSAWQPDQFPGDSGAEVAFAGRSNAGKSSAINVITGKGGLARTSKTPGRTQLVNFFGLAPSERLVDLPGYGYAKVPPKMQAHWRTLMSDYFESRESLKGIVVVMDARRPLTDFDWQMIEWSRQRPRAVHLLLTKCDKLNRTEMTAALREVSKATAEFASAQLFSATQKTGLDQARGTVTAMLVGKWEAASKKKPQ
jgi:GTP-binding protein